VISAGAYLTGSLVASTQISRREEDPKLLFLMPLIFGMRHIAHGLGALLGLVLVVVPGYHWKSRRRMSA
jgi:hypothetical protein